MSLIDDLKQMVTSETYSVLADQRRWMEATLAGAALRSRPRRRDRTYTGQVGSRRVYRGRLIRMSDGRIGQIDRAIRGLVTVRVPDLAAVVGHQEFLVRADDIELHKDPAAVLLGAMKRGVTERPSARKGRAARQNGRRPCRPGRRRGRPKGKPPATGPTASA